MTHPLKSYRLAARRTISDIAERVGVTKGCISKIENGKALPSLGLAARLSAETGGLVEVSDFLAFAPVPGVASLPPADCPPASSGAGGAFPEAAA